MSRLNYYCIFHQALQDECQEITASGGARQYGATDHVTTYDANGKVVHDPYVSKVDIKIKEDPTHTPKEENPKQGMNDLLFD